VPTLLHIDSSLDLSTSRSRAITAAFAAAWLDRGPGFDVVRRDLTLDPVPHLPDPALHWAPRLRAPGATPPPAAEALQTRLIEELVAADAVVIGAPLYNYSMASSLKAWVDHIHVPGVTAPFDTDTQPVAGRPAVVVTSRGGAYDPGTPTAGWDHAVPPLAIVLGEALGMSVTVITTSLTLAGTVPALGEFADRAAAELDEATREAARLGRSLPV
jgi:FMN-dependent NADH-azoreductase